MSVTLDDLRRFAIARSLFTPTTLARSLDALGFVQADPIRAPARAQDLTLRHRVTNYRVGDLDRRYARLGVQEDVLVNYGFVTRAVQALMHPRAEASPWSTARRKKVQALLEFVRAHGEAHPREVDAHFSHGTVTNYWGGSSSATTHLLEDMHYYGLLRVAHRAAGIRIYAVQEHGPGPVDAAERIARIDALVDVVVGKYAPLPAACLSTLVSRLRYAVPQWHGELKAALRRATGRLAHARVGEVDWYWPASEHVPVGSRRGRGSRHADNGAPELVRLLAPFDPVVWDCRRFEMFWGWAYRFEAYTPVSKRKRGYYALPLLWRDRVIGWGNVSVSSGALEADVGYIDGRPPRDRRFAQELDAELDRLRAFLGVRPGTSEL